MVQQCRVFDVGICRVGFSIGLQRRYPVFAWCLKYASIGVNCKLVHLVMFLADYFRLLPVVFIKTNQFYPAVVAVNLAVVDIIDNCNIIAVD